jgi:hypothetical protein
MGQPSLIMVEQIEQSKSNSDGEVAKVSFRLTGKIEVDSREEIEVDLQVD